MVDDYTRYSFNQYLFDIENYVALNIECDIVLPIHIWRDIFEDNSSSIFNAISNKYDVTLNFNRNSMTKRLGLHFIQQGKDGTYGSEFIILRLDIIDKIKMFKRELKIDQLCKQ